MLLSDFGRFGFEPLFGEMRRMQNEMNRLMSGAGASAVARGFPPLGLWVGENSVVVSAELPGVGAEDLDITVHEDVLTLQGKREAKDVGEDVVWHRQERDYGGFSRTIQLPFRVDPERVNARFDNGVLQIELRRPEADLPKKIQIRVG